MSVVDLSELVSALSNTLSASKDCRTAAESYLNNARMKPGFLVYLVKMAAEEALDQSVRTAALVCLKNEISRNWRKESDGAADGTPDYSEEDRANCKAMLLQLSAHVSPLLVTERRLVDECLYHILLQDFPNNWPELQPTVVQLCSDRSQITRVIAGINLLVKLGRKYDLASSKEATTAIGELLAVCCPLLFELVASFDSPDKLFATQEISYFTKQFCKLYYVTSHSMRNSEYYQKSFDQWMNLIAAVLQARVPADQLRDAPQIDRLFSVKAKKWGLYSLRTAIIRYCTPKHLKNGESVPQTSVFAERHVIKFIQMLLDLIEGVVRAQSNGLNCGLSSGCGTAVGTQAPDGSVVPFIINDVQLSVILDAVSQTLEFAAGYKLVKPHIEMIIVHLCHPLLCYNDQDIENREMDPTEYARNNATGLYIRSFDIGHNPAHAAGGFLAAVMRLRSKDFLASATTFIQNEFNSYKLLDGSQRAIGSQGNKRKFGALKMLSEVAPRLTCRKRNLELVIEDLLYEHVAPELQSPDPWLRGCAAEVLASMFRTWELSLVKPNSLIEVLVQVLRNCRDEDCTVRLETLRAVAVLVNLENDTVKAFLSQHAKDVCELLVTMTDDFNISESAVTALTQLCESFPDEIIVLAPNLVQKLVSTYLNMAQTMAKLSTTQTQTTEIDGDELELTLSSVVQTLVSVCCVMGRDPACSQHMSVIAPILEPFLDHALSPAGEDYIEDALQCLALVTYDIPKIPANYWRYFDVMYQAVCGGPKPIPPTEINPNGAWGQDEFPTFVATIDNYLMRGQDVLVSETSPLTGIPYKEELFQMIRTGLATSDSNLDNPTAALLLIWLLADSFAPIGGADLANFVLDMSEQYITVQESEGIYMHARGPEDGAVPRLAKEQLVRIYATLICATGLSAGTINGDLVAGVNDASRLTQTLAAMNSRTVFGLQQWLALVFKPKMMLQSETKKMVIGAVCIMVEWICAGGEGSETLKAFGPSLVKVLEDQAVAIARARAKEKALEEESDWDENSEQDLEENDDAAPNFFNFGNTLEEDEDEDDDDFIDSNLMDFGERRSPFDTFSDNVTVLRLIERRPDIFTSVSGTETVQELVRHLQTQIAAEAAAANTPAK